MREPFVGIEKYPEILHILNYLIHLHCNWCINKGWPWFRGITFMFFCASRCLMSLPHFKRPQTKQGIFFSRRAVSTIICCTHFSQRNTFNNDSPNLYLPVLAKWQRTYVQTIKAYLCEIYSLLLREHLSKDWEVKVSNEVALSYKGSGQTITPPTAMLLNYKVGWNISCG